MDKEHVITMKSWDIGVSGEDYTCLVYYTIKEDGSIEIVKTYDAKGKEILNERDNQ